MPFLQVYQAGIPDLNIHFPNHGHTGNFFCNQVLSLVWLVHFEYASELVKRRSYALHLKRYLYQDRMHATLWHADYLKGL